MATKSFAIDTALLPRLLVRCRNKDCRKFVVQAHVAILGCACCDWHTAFCHDCGGEDSAENGARAHVMYFARRKVALERYGQAHKVMLQDVQQSRRKKVA